MLKIFKGGDLAAALVNLFQCLTTVKENNFFLCPTVFPLLAFVAILFYPFFTHPKRVQFNVFYNYPFKQLKTAISLTELETLPILLSLFSSRPNSDIYFYSKVMCFSSLNHFGGPAINFLQFVGISFVQRVPNWSKYSGQDTTSGLQCNPHFVGCLLTNAAQGMASHYHCKNALMSHVQLIQASQDLSCKTELFMYRCIELFCLSFLLVWRSS